MRKYIFWFLLASVVLTACDAEPVKVSVTMESDYSQIIDAINSANQTLTTKMALIESALSQGFADNREAQELLRQALASLSGTAAEKLAAVEAAVKSQTASLELKLGLIEAALTGGFADASAQQKLLQAAIQALSGTMEEKLALIDGAIKSQTASLETKLGLIEAAISGSLAEASSQQELLRTALESLQGTLEEKLALVEAAVKSQTVSLETKLGLIEQSVTEGLSGNQESLLLIQKALDALEGTLETKLASVEAAIKSETAGLEGKLALIEAAAKKGFADSAQQQKLILQAVEALSGTLDAKLTAISTVMASQQTELDIKLGLLDAAVEKGYTDRGTVQSQLLIAIQSLEGDASAKLASITSAVSKETASLWARLVLIETAFNEGLSDEATALGQIEQAISNSTAEEGIVNGIVKKIQAIKTTLNENVTTALGDIFTSINNLAGYREILETVNWSLYKLADHSINGYEYVEMAPGLKWATMNMGATRPEERGDYYAWGELRPKDNYYWTNYKFWHEEPEHPGLNQVFYITKYTFEDDVFLSRWYNWGVTTFCGDGITWLGEPIAGYDFADDAARQNWGSSWRIPTKEDWTELDDPNRFDWKWTADYNGSGAAGALIISRVAGFEGNRIFLPLAGCKMEETIDMTKTTYWSSNLSVFSQDAWSMCLINNSRHYLNGMLWRCYGMQIRPVSN